MWRGGEVDDVEGKGGGWMMWRGGEAVDVEGRGGMRCYIRYS